MAFNVIKKVERTKSSMQGQHSQTIENEWNTPVKYIESARNTMGEINVDPATNADAQHVINADVFFTIENSCLADDVEFKGKVWMNPAYDRTIAKFIAKLNEQVEAGNVTEFIVLTNNGTDTGWFKLLSKHAHHFCHTDHRIAFINKFGVEMKGNNKGQVFSYFGPNPDKFKAEFSKWGLVTCKA